MTHKELKKKSKALAAQIQDNINHECNRLIKTGAIDPSNYGDNYELAKIIMVAALENVKRPLLQTMLKESKEEIENLLKF